MVRWSLPLLAGLALLLTCLGGEVRPAALLEWYLTLNRPWWQPPDWVIPLVWLVIYALIALAIRRAWQGVASDADRHRVLLVSTVNLFLNGFWAVLFFIHRRPDWALAEVVALWASIIWMIVVFARQSRSAAWLLVPYLVWVTFAAVLNLAIVRLNAPFP
jgi:benzodiazapine receptor